MIVIQELTLKDLHDIKLHPANVEELAALSPADTKRCLAYMYGVSDEAYVVKNENDILCVSGISQSGELWLMFADISALPLSFFKETSKAIDKWLGKYPDIHTVIYEKNVFALRWAKFVKAHLGEAKAFGYKNKIFRSFLLTKEMRG